MEDHNINIDNDMDEARDILMFPLDRAGRVAPLLPLFTSGLAWLGVTWPS